MNTAITPPILIDRDAERRRALAKVYALLIKLADDTEDPTIIPETNVLEKDRAVNLKPKQLVLL
jgi:hypothetical protein